MLPICILVICCWVSTQFYLISCHDRIQPFIKTGNDISVGSVQYDCGTSRRDSVIVVYYGDIGAMYPATVTLDDQCSSVYKPHLVNVLEIKDKVRCGFERYLGLDTWTVAVHVQMEKWRVTARDEMYYLTCDYTSSKHHLTIATSFISDGFIKPIKEIEKNVEEIRKAHIEKENTEIDHDEGDQSKSTSERKDHGRVKLLLEDEYSNIVTNVLPGQLVRLRLQRTRPADKCDHFATPPTDCVSGKGRNEMSNCSLLTSTPFLRCNQIIPVSAYIKSCLEYHHQCARGCKSCDITPEKHLCAVLQAYECACQESSVHVAWHPLLSCPTLHMGMRIDRCRLVISRPGKQSRKISLPKWCQTGAQMVGNSHTLWSLFFTMPDSVAAAAYVQLQCDVVKCTDHMACHQACKKKISKLPSEFTENESDQTEDEKRRKKRGAAEDGQLTVITEIIWVILPNEGKKSLGTGSDEIIRTNTKKVLPDEGENFSSRHSVSPFTSPNIRWGSSIYSTAPSIKSATNATNKAHTLKLNTNDSVRNLFHNTTNNMNDTSFVFTTQLKTTAKKQVVAPLPTIAGPRSEVVLNTSYLYANASVPCIYRLNDLLPYYISLAILGVLLLVCVVVICCIMRRNRRRRGRRYNTEVPQALPRQPVKRHYGQPLYLGQGALEERCQGVSPPASGEDPTCHKGRNVHEPAERVQSNPTESQRPFEQDAHPLIGWPEPDSHGSRRPHPLYEERSPQELDGQSEQAGQLSRQQARSDPDFNPDLSFPADAPIHIPRPVLDPTVMSRPPFAALPRDDEPALPRDNVPVSVSPWEERAMERDRHIASRRAADNLY